MTANIIVKVASILVCTIPMSLMWSANAPTPGLAEPGAHAVTASLYADGSVQCTGADDLSNRVGTVVLRPVGSGISFHVVLTDAAPAWDYYVELSQDGTCMNPQRFFGFTTGKNGNGVFKGVLATAPGSYQILVDVVSDPSSNIPPNPTHREIAPADLIRISVP